MYLLKLKLIAEIKSYQNIDPADLQQLLLNDKSEPQFLLIPNLFFYGFSQFSNFSYINNYINTINNTFFTLNSLNINEQQWYNFYTLLRAYKNSKKDVQLIINQYEQLPILNSDKIYMNWILYKVKLVMISYYLYLNQDTTILLKEIKQIPQEVKDLQY